MAKGRDTVLSRLSNPNAGQRHDARWCRGGVFLWGCGVFVPAWTVCYGKFSRILMQKLINSHHFPSHSLALRATTLKLHPVVQEIIMHLTVISEFQSVRPKFWNSCHKINAKMCVVCYGHSGSLCYGIGCGALLWGVH